MSYRSFLHLMVIVIIFALTGSKIKAQDFTFSITPSNSNYAPVVVDNSWHVVQPATSYSASFTLPDTREDEPTITNLTDSTSVQERVVHSYSFLGYRVGSSSTNYSATELQAFLRTTSETNIAIKAACLEKNETFRTEYLGTTITSGPAVISSNEREIISSQAVAVKLYAVPTFTTQMAVEGSSAQWSSSATSSFSYTTSGGGTWSGDLYYTINNGAKQMATNNTLSVPLTCEEEVSVIVVKMENIKCLAPDGQTEWTPAEAKNDRSFTYTIYPIPSASRESTVSASTYVFNGKTITLTPSLFGGEENSWTYSWETAAGTVSTTGPSIELSTTNNRLNAATSSRATTTIKLTATNQPAGVASALSATVSYTIYTVAQPEVTMVESDYMDFEGKTFEISFTVEDSNPAYYPTQNSVPTYYILQNGQQIPLIHSSGNTYTGSSSYSATITPTVKDGKEIIKVYWSRQLEYVDGYYHEECQLFEFNKEIELNICRKPSLSDLDFSECDQYALAREGYLIDFNVSALPLTMPGTWTYQWEPNNATTAHTVYSVSDVPTLSGNETASRPFNLVAKYKLQNQSNSVDSISTNVTIIFCAEPEGHTLNDDIVTCVGIPTNLGLSYSGGYSNGWSTRWYDESGNELSDFSGDGGVVTINSDIVQDFVEKQYRAELINKYKEKTWATIPLLFDLTIYKRPSVSVAQIPFGHKEGEVDLYSGETDQIVVNPDGGYPNGWQYEWLVNNSMNNNKENHQTVVPELVSNEDGMLSKQYKVRVRNYYSGSNTAWCDSTYTVDYSFWSRGGLNLATKDSKGFLYGDDSTCDGQIWNSTVLAIGTKGGYSDGWTFEWNIIENPENVLSQSPNNLQKSAMNTVKALNNTGMVQSTRIQLIAKNAINSEKVGNTITEDFDIIVYPKAVTSSDFYDNLTVNRYYGDTDELNISVSGGNTDNWNYAWSTTDNAYNNCHVDSSAPYRYFSSTKEDNTLEAVDQFVTRKVIASNYSPDGLEKWYEKEYAFPVHLWSRGKVTSDSDKSFNLYGGNKFNIADLIASVSGGYNSGNSNSLGNNYNWVIKEGNEYVIKDVASDDTQSICSVTVTNRSGKQQDAKIMLIWQNKIDDAHIGSVDSIEYTLQISPGADQIPAAIEGWTSTTPNNPEKVRDIDGKTLSVNKGVGGYQWGYRWSDNGVVVDSGTSVSKTFNLNVEGNRKNESVREIELYWFNQSPDGIIWEEGTLKQYLKVYNTPVKPSRIKLKGSGASNIYIAEMDDTGLSDEQLFSSAYDYALQFGEGNSDTSIAEETTQRWHQYSSSPRTPWVRSCWHYDDFDCCSDMVDIDGNTRAYTGIHEIEAEAGSEPILVLRLNGTLVKVTDSENISELELMPGMYIIKNAITGSSKKILINN